MAKWISTSIVRMGNTFEASWCYGIHGGMFVTRDRAAAIAWLQSVSIAIASR